MIVINLIKMKSLIRSQPTDEQDALQKLKKRQLRELKRKLRKGHKEALKRKKAKMNCAGGESSKQEPNLI